MSSNDYPGLSHAQPEKNRVVSENTESTVRKGKSADIYTLVVKDVDAYLEEFPNTPPQTILAALTRVLELYQPTTQDSDESITGGAVT